MKKIIILYLIICITSLDAFAQQEVRGIQTRRVIYNGDSYKADNGIYTEYYGWELYNCNKFTVSVDIELWLHDHETTNNQQLTYFNQIVRTQSIVLSPEEKYIFKNEDMESAHLKHSYYARFYGIGCYYITYKAYKLE